MRHAKHQMTNDPVVLRIVELLKEKGIPERDFVKAIGLSNGAFTKWKYHESKGYMLHINKMAELLQVTPNYLLRDEGKVEIQNLSEKETELLSMYRAMTDKMKENIIETSRNFVELTVLKKT